MLDRDPGRKIMRDCPPLATCTDHVENPVEIMHNAYRRVRLLGWDTGKHLSSSTPLCICQITALSFSFYP